jgi:hypothetical protein
MTEANCPLCGVKLDLPKQAEPPTVTLERLGKHFAEDCTATVRIPDI